MRNGTVIESSVFNQILCKVLLKILGKEKKASVWKQKKVKWRKRGRSKTTFFFTFFPSRTVWFAGFSDFFNKATLQGENKNNIATGAARFAVSLDVFRVAVLSSVFSGPIFP